MIFDVSDSEEDTKHVSTNVTQFGLSLWPGTTKFPQGPLYFDCWLPTGRYVMIFDVFDSGDQDILSMYYCK